MGTFVFGVITIRPNSDEVFMYTMSGNRKRKTPPCCDAHTLLLELFTDYKTLNQTVFSARLRQCIPGLSVELIQGLFATGNTSGDDEGDISGDECGSESSSSDDDGYGDSTLHGYEDDGFVVGSDEEV